MYKGIQLLIIDDDPTVVKVFERLAKDHNWTYKVARDGATALEIFAKELIEVAVMDIMLPGMSGMQLLETVKTNKYATEVIMITGVGSVESAVQAIKIGAYDYLTKPFEDIEKVAILIEKARERFELVQKIRRLERRGTDRYQFEEMVGKSNKMQEVFQIIEAIAPTSATVLILGESGTGKELAARAVHRRSTRKDRPFVVINCAAIPETLLESELFGHRKGSFTGAISDKRGLFEEADMGTIFLDEIGEIPVQTQVKLLRVLQEGEIRAVGGNHTHKVDVRLIAATNKDLQQQVKLGKFREDLFYRLNVINIVMPALRDRMDDVPMLAYHFLKKHAAKLKKTIDKISVDALQALQNYSWVGNVRELENVVERASVLATEDTLHAQELPAAVLGESFYQEDSDGARDLAQFNYQEAKDRALLSFNRSYLANLLKQAHGNISIASEKAGMDRSNFKKIIRKYQVDVIEYKRSGK